MLGGESRLAACFNTLVAFLSNSGTVERCLLPAEPVLPAAIKIKYHVIEILQHKQARMQVFLNSNSPDLQVGLIHFHPKIQNNIKQNY